VAGETLGDVLRRIGRLAGLQGVLLLTDAQLLERFAVGRDEPAFAALMVRHGPMVLGVCRQLLHDADQADDAFQASFLVLARKAGSIQRRTLLSAWLYGVAHKVAARLRGRARKRQSRETSGVDLASVAATVEPEPPELPPLLHQEVQRLPDKYRNPIVLCYLEGKTHEEAALLLRWPLGTVKGRLARARDLLRTRLTRRGVTASEGVMATALAANPVTARAKLVDATIRAATRFAAGDGGAGGLVSARAIALTQGVLRTMMLTKVKIAAVLVLAVTMLGGGGAGWLAFRAPAAEPGVPVAKADDKSKEDKDAIQGTWQVAGIEAGGKDVPDNEATKQMKLAKWIITADKITYAVPKMGEQNASYKLDPTKKPKELDFTWLEGPLKGKPVLGIYSLEGDVLKLCMPGPGFGPRPTELAAAEGAKTILHTLKRVPADKDKPKEDKPKDDAAKPKDDAKVKKLLADWCDVTKEELDARMQEFTAGKIIPDLALSAAQRLFKAEVERSETRVDRLAAYEAYLRRITDVATIANTKLEAGKIAIADLAEANSYRLEAEILLEREKAK
jgi:RNA polymerase sigma factor (sigma-70 family)